MRFQKVYLITFAIIFNFLEVGASTVNPAAQSCYKNQFERLINNPLESHYAFLREERERMMSTFFSQFHENAQALRQRLSSTIKSNSSIEYPYIIIGGGAHGGIVSRTLSHNHPEIKGLVIEQSENVSDTFHRIGRATYLTSPDKFNKVPGAPLSVKDLNYRQGELGTTEELKHSQFLNHYASDNDFLFSEKVFKIEVEDATEPVFIIKTNDFTFRTKHLVIAPGIGTARNFVEPHPKIKNLIQLLEDSHKSAELDLDPRMIYQNRRVAIIGGGGGAQAGVALLSGHGPRSLFKNGIDPPKEIIWIGTQYESAGHFKKTNTIPGHSQITHKIESGEVKLADGKVSSVRTKKINDQEIFEIAYSHNGVSFTQEADDVIVAIGYENQVQTLFDQPFTFSTIRGNLDEKGNPLEIGQQYSHNGKAFNIMLVGPGATMKIPDYEMASTYSKLPQSMEVIGKRTLQVSQQISRNIGRVQNHAQLTKKISNYELIVTPSPTLYRSPLIRKDFILVEMIKILNRMSLPKGTSVKFKTLGTKRVKVEINGAQDETEKIIIEALKKNQILLNEIRQNMSIELNILSDDIPTSENLSFKIQ